MHDTLENLKLNETLPRQQIWFQDVTNKMLRVAGWTCILLLCFGCTPRVDPSPEKKQPLFVLLPPERTGVDFSNTLREAPGPQRNLLLFEYFSNGAGVAVGDLNGDGLEDLFFTANMGYSRLYLNKGNLTFEEATEAAGIAGRPNTWKTGVSIADVNGDGRLDVYVCYSGDLPMDRRVDELFINQGNDAGGVPRFLEQAEAYGLANPHSSNQAYFFDYDRDNDLDLFLLTHNVKNLPRLDKENTLKQLQVEDPVSGVRFYRNDGERFEDVTRSTNLVSSALTYGLGAGVADINKDGWTDIYVGNDYNAPDYLYLNNGDGTFTDHLGDQIGHTSNASMGIDVADINNDGWLDILVLDMLAADNYRQKTQFIPDNRAAFYSLVDMGFHHQYMRNTLQLNNGNGTFSEIGQLAGVSNTDWSWSPLIADLDNDGAKDIFVTNGYLHDAFDRDFLALKSNYVASRQQNLEPGDVGYLMSLLPSTVMTNYAFQNGGNLQFKDVSADWGLDAPLLSTGAAYADLDNDGDLDLVTNNINKPVSIFENQSMGFQSHNYLQVDLQGTSGNVYGVGARVTLYAAQSRQYIEQMPARGYLSSVSSVLHFGLGQELNVDSLRVDWPDGSTEVVGEIAANQRITINQVSASVDHSVKNSENTYFIETPPSISFVHEMAGDIDDFRRQPLLDHPQSFTGPALATGDVNNDGREDLFVGGGNSQAGALFVQREDGRFVRVRQPALLADADHHDANAAFFDADNDGFVDLYVASGGYGLFEPDDALLQDRLYLNDGKGNFARADDALPEMLTSTGAVAVHDINGDGFSDVFVGGYVVPGRYPESPRSYMLVNNGAGKFEDKTAEIGAGLIQAGMIRDAAWADLNGDGTAELIVAGAWMPIRVFANQNGQFEDVTDDYFERLYHGLWNTLLVEDLNNDGLLDIVAGNLGTNTQLKVNEEQPAQLYFSDFNNDGTIDPLLTRYIQGTSHLAATLDEMRAQLPVITSRIPSHRAYANASIKNLFEDGRLAEASVLTLDQLETSIFWGRKEGRFEPGRLPVEAQMAPVFAIHALDYDGDGNKDLLLAGNTNEATVRWGRHDASYGVLLNGLGEPPFQYVPQRKSGFKIKGPVRDIVALDNEILFGINRAALQAYRQR